MADESEYIFFTYDEAAKRLGIKPDSIRRRASARRWPKKMGNDGLARVGIPTTIIPDAIPEITPEITPDNYSIREELAKTKEALARAEGYAEATASRLIDLAADRDAWKAQAERLASEARPAVGVSIWSRIFGQ